MANSWVRLWVDMPTDPKWRTIARVSGQPISVVISTFIFLMIYAANATERGTTETNKTEDIATALDVDESSIIAIIDAMQGRVLDGDLLIGWRKRQPLREDNSIERVRKYRKRNVTQCNAPDKDKDKDKDKDNIFLSDSNEIRLSNLLFNLILKNNPKAKTPNFNSWAKHIDFAIRIDGRTPEELEQVIRWCQKDSFWQSNILSAEKLRKQFDQLWIKMGGISPQDGPPANPNGNRSLEEVLS